MSVLLPAATDVFLLGAKSHHSEIRLAKFMVQQLKATDHFLDIGAHFGYFSLLAANLCQDGKVIAVDASKSNFELLAHNTKSTPNLIALNLAVASAIGTLKFYEFATKYSEYNAKDIEQYKDEDWFKSNPPKEIEIAAITVDKLIATNNTQPFMIKIDVEGAEAEVIQGAHAYLSTHQPIIVMEYLLKPNTASSSPHQTAAQMLNKLGYESHQIGQNGRLTTILNIDKYMLKNGFLSDNIVFKKSHKKLA